MATTLSRTHSKSRARPALGKSAVVVLLADTILAAGAGHTGLWSDLFGALTGDIAQTAPLRGLVADTSPLAPGEVLRARLV